MKFKLKNGFAFFSCIVFVLAFGVIRITEAFELELPNSIEDISNKITGVAPFGYHVAEHRYDGHPGIDFFYIPGTTITAAIGGTLQVFSDSYDPAKKTVQINFSEKSKNYRIVYTNFSALEPGIESGAKVTTGQVLGTAGSQTQIQDGGVPVTYAMTHFQVDDFSISYGLTNKTAVTPEHYFSATAKTALDQIWAISFYHQMVCEPFLTNPRGLLANPTLIRSWTKNSGVHAERVDFVCDYVQNGIYRYILYNTEGNVIETGTATVKAKNSSIPTIDLTPVSGAVRKGVISVKDNKMLLAYSVPAGNQPDDLAGASEYSTGRDATACATADDAVCFFGNNSPFRSGDALSAGITLNWEKLTKTASQADLWVAIQFSDGTLLFCNDNPSGWTTTPVPCKQQLNNAAKQLTIIDSLPVTTAMTGSYNFYAVLGESGKGINELQDSVLSNLALSVFFIAQ